MGSKFIKFLGKIFGDKTDEKEKELAKEMEKEEEKSSREKILYSDLDNFIKKRIEKDEARIRNQADPLIDKCLESIENMKNIVKSIQAEKIQGLNKRAERIVESNKVMFVKIVENVLNIEINKDANISEIKEKVLKIARTCGEMDIQYGRYVAVAHPQMENFRKNMKALANTVMDLNKLYTDKYEEYIILKEKQGVYLNEKTIIAEVQDLLKELENELHNKQENLKALRNSEKFRSLNDALNEKDKILAEKERIEGSIYSKISAIGRILKKIRKKNNIREISIYIDDPKIFLERDDKEILNFLKLPADLNEDERNKILSFGNASPSMVEEKKRYKEILEKVERTNKDIKMSDVRGEIKGIEDDIASISVKIEQNKKEAERLEKGVQNLQKEIFEIKNKLGDKLNRDIEMEM